MIEHPVPQNITSYQFHLIGNMTIKQFLMLLAGAGVGFLFYTTNLPGLLKWPLILAFFGGSAAAAFVPYEDRTLDQWLVNFVKAIYRPTKYFWRREPTTPLFLDYQPRSQADAENQATATARAMAPIKRQQISAYLSSLNSAPVAAGDPLDVFTNQSQQMVNLFDTTAAAANVTPGEDKPVKPELGIRARPLIKRIDLYSSQTANQVTKVNQPPASHVSTTAPTSPNQTLVADQNQTTSEKIPTGEVVYEKVPTLTMQSTTSDLAESSPTTPVPASTQVDTAHYLNQTVTSSSQGAGQLQPVVFDRSLPFPSLPDKPNLILGMVYDQNNKIIPSSIVEILDEAGSTVRAMKTNSLGQFYISSPLHAGKYRIETEADGFMFPIYELEINDQVLEPIKITGQTTTKN